MKMAGLDVKRSGLAKGAMVFVMMGLPALLVTTALATPLTTGDEFVDSFSAESGRHGPRLIHVQEQAFRMGDRPEELGYSPDAPRHRVRLSAFAIAKFEITNAEFCAFLNEAGNQRAEDVPWALVGEKDSHCRIIKR